MGQERLDSPNSYRMRTAVTILFAVAFLTGCSSRQPSTSPPGVALAGSYYRGDHTGYNIYLDLQTVIAATQQHDPVNSRRPSWFQRSERFAARRGFTNTLHWPFRLVTR